MDVDGAGGVLLPQRVLHHARVIPRILQPRSVDVDSGVFPVGDNTPAAESGPGAAGNMETRGANGSKRRRGNGRLAAPTRMCTLRFTAGAWFHSANGDICNRLLVQRVFPVAFDSYIFSASKMYGQQNEDLQSTRPSLASSLDRPKEEKLCASELSSPSG